jgi:hypothetical protein
LGDVAVVCAELGQLMDKVIILGIFWIILYFTNVPDPSSASGPTFISIAAHVIDELTSARPTGNYLDYLTMSFRPFTTVSIIIIDGISQGAAYDNYNNDQKNNDPSTVPRIYLVLTHYL